MPKTNIRFTYEDYLQTPEDKRYELIEGDLLMVPSPNTYHQEVSRNLEFILWSFIRQNDLGHIFDAPMDVVLMGEDVVQPDILFISKERSSIIKVSNIDGAPDLVIEITSPSSRERDRTIKRKLYARSGVTEYWLIDSEARTVEVMSATDTGFETVRVYHSKETLESPLLKGLSMQLNEVF